MSASPAREGLQPAPASSPTAVPTITTTTTSTGRTSTGLQHPRGPDSTPDRRLFGLTTDDAAVFIEDTVDRTTAQRISASPSALAVLSPQRMPDVSTHVDVTEYDAAHLGSSAKRSRSSGLLADGDGAAAGHSSAVRLSFGRSPNPKPLRKSTGARVPRAERGGGASLNTSLNRSTPGRSRPSAGRPHSNSTPSPAAADPRDAETPIRVSDGSGATDESPEPMVSLWELERTERELHRVERERNRFEKMYEHQRALYESMSDKHAETYQSLQEKIVEVVALSTRNEESKKFIRQLKREMAESRTRVMHIQNRALEETRAERDAKSRYEAMMDEQEHKYSRAVERHETKMAAMESLVKDLTFMKSERDRIHVSQLDSLLKAAYAKSTALFSDLLRQGRQVDSLYDSKDALERQVDQLRREKRELEATLAEERRRMMYESERFIDQIEEQQQAILNLRQMLIRTLDFAEDDNDDDDDDEVDIDVRSGHSDHDSRGEERDEEVEVEGEGDRSFGGSRGVSRRYSHPRRLRATSHSAEHEEAEADKDDAPADRRSSGSLAEEEEEEDCGVRSGSEGSTLAYLRSQISSTRSGRRPGHGTRGDDEGHEADADSEKENVSAAKSVTTVRSAVSALSSNAVVAAARRSAGESIFHPPQQQQQLSAVATSSGAGKALPLRERTADVKVVEVSRTVGRRPTSTAGSGEKAVVDGRRHAPAPHRGAAREERRGADEENTTPPAAARTAPPVVAAARKRLDFTTALAAVTAKREQDRRARNRSHSADKENRPDTPPAAITATAKSSTAGKRPLAPLGANGSGKDADDDDDDDSVPRLVPRQVQQRASTTTPTASTATAAAKGARSSAAAGGRVVHITRKVVEES